MQRILLDDPYVTITLDDEIGVLRYIRSHEPYPSLDTLRALNAKIREVFATFPAKSHHLLIDVREARPRNDEAFETEIKDALIHIAARFARRATLVKSAVGRLQTQRIAKANEKSGAAKPRSDSRRSHSGAWGAEPPISNDRDIAVFSDEREALAYLAEAKPSAERDKR